MRSFLAISIFIGLSLILRHTHAQIPQVIYVNKAAAGSANGTSWANAYPQLQAALTAAALISGPKEIWVARAEYKPTTDINRSLSFMIPSQTFLYGGFVGNETSKDARNWIDNRTVLSGDLGKQFDKNDNSYHVVVAKDINVSSGLDGFIIKEGNADGTSSFQYGGGLLIWSTGSTTAPKITNCELVGNYAKSGAGIATLSENNGIVSPEITNTSFNGNLSTSLGGGLYVSSSSLNSPACINCSFSTNISQEYGGAVANFGAATFTNCTMTYNKAGSLGPAVYNVSNFTLRNSVVWKNFSGNFDAPNFANQISDQSAGTSGIVSDNIVQGDYGPEAANNVDADPSFEKEPSFIGKYPRTSVIPTQYTDPKYENQLETSGLKMPGWWTYYTFMDHQYNKLYITGNSLETIDFNNLTDGLPTSTHRYPEIYFGRISRLESAVHGSKIYLETGYSGMKTIDRVTGVISSILPVLQGQPITFDYYKAEDIYIDTSNNLLYSPIFYSPGNIFYGLLEWNIVTDTKRWINSTSSPVSIPQVNNSGDDGYWNGHRLYMDQVSNTLFYSMGNGVWWWNRSNNTTGVYNTTGGIPLAQGSPNLPSDLTTSMYIDHTENKFYIGTHAGLFVWDRNTNTSRVYNTSNSKMMHNLVDHIDKSDGQNLVFVACEYGGLFTINTVTGEEKLYTKDDGNETYPQMVDTDISSGNFDDVDNKLYVSAYNPKGGVWVKDYNNLVPDYGDLRLKAGSPAIDRGNASFLPSGLTVDINGLNRLVDYAALFGQNSLDLGAYEKVFQEEDAPAPAIADNLGMNYVLTYNAVKEGIKDESTLDNFPVKDVNRSIQYIDGIGRPVQSIAIQGSPTRSDIVQPIVYDEFGREAVTYLPFTQGSDGSYRNNSVGANSPQQNYYDGNDPKIAHDATPFSTTVFEPSPLNRTLKNYGAGQIWSQAENDKPVVHDYLSNIHGLAASATDEAIFAFTVNTTGVLILEDAVSGYIETGGYYSSSQLFIKSTKDEHGNAVREYTNKQGQVILKKVQAEASSISLNDTNAWASTYYVYDHLGNLAIVLQPEGVRNLTSLLNQN